MPKMKTHRGAAKRFKVKKNSIKRGTAFRSHILTKVEPATRRELNSPKTVHKVDEPRISKMLCK